jgi:hypothetical protein
MASKKYKFLLGILLCLSSGAFAQVQTDGSYNVYDTSVIPNRRMGQQNEFWNKQYNFPAKPRNMWEVGASIGMLTISGDVSVRPFTFPNFEVHVRKAFGYVFSLRAQYLNGTGKGMNYNIAQNFLKNPAWNTNIASVANRYYAPDAIANASSTGLTTSTDNAGHVSPRGNDVVYYNYKTHIQDLGVQGIVTLNNVRFHKKKTGFIVYGGAGIGVSWFHAKVNALNDGNGGGNYASLFQSVFNKYGSGSYKQRKDILKDLKAGMDDTYETEADNERVRRPVFGDNVVKPSGTVLAGFEFRLGKRINLSLEDRWTFVKTDLLDGQRWQEHAWGDAVLTRDFDSYNMLSLGVNVNLGSKAVEPLWWLNPLDYAYDELMNHRHVVMPKSECPDADGDGVCDHLDREPNTPANCPVDTHGVTKDTDGDGVPDCKDKQLITPTECQPVDADGVGKCPEHCCDKPDTLKPQCACDYPSLNFKGAGAGKLTADNKAMLASIATKMKAGPTCAITITGYPATDKRAQAACQKRLDMIKKYLTETEGISSDRITTNCEVGTDKDANTVDVNCNQ